MNRNALRLGAAVTAVGALLLVSAPAEAASLPISDPSAIGVVGLCNQSLKPISNGSLDTAPFVWRAVGSTAAKGAYAKYGGTATLFAYQPRPEVPAGEWSGTQLTASGHYTNPAYPMDQATKADLTLADFVAEFPPQVDGLLELRLYLGGPDLPLQTTQYDATFIRVTGSTWSVAQGGTVKCNDGRSVSPESVLLPSSVVNPKPSTSSTPSTGSQPSTSTPSGGTGSSAAGSSAPAAAASPQNVADSSSSKHAGSSIGWVALGVICLLGLGLGAGSALRRRRTT